jgi:hypothetical protein
MHTSPIGKYKYILDEGLDSQKRQKGSVDWAFTLSFFLIILLSGCIQIFDIRVLASVNIAVQMWLLFKVKFKLSRKLLIVIKIFSLYLVYSVVITGFNADLVYVIFRYYDFIAAFILLNYFLIKRPDFNRTFSLIMWAFLVHGFLGFLFANLFFDSFVSVDQADFEYIHTLFGVFFATDSLSLGFHRSQSLFWEPGVYQIYLNAFMFYVCFWKQKTAMVPIILFAIASTFSTTGLVLAVFQMAIFLFKKLNLSLSGLIWFFISIVFLVSFLQLTSNNLEDKISGDNKGSSWARQFDAINGIQVLLNNPLGIGFSPLKYQDIAKQNPYRIETLLNTDRGQTNGLVELFYSTGFIFGFIFIYYLTKQRVFNRNQWVFNIVILVCMLSEPLVFSPFFFFFVMSGMAASKK